VTTDPVRIEQKETLLAIRVIDLIVLVFLPLFVFGYSAGATAIAVASAWAAWGVGVLSLALSFSAALVPATRYLTLTSILGIILLIFFEPLTGHGYLVLFAIPPAVLFVSGPRLGTIANTLVWAAAVFLIFNPGYSSWQMPGDATYRFVVVASYTMLNILTLMVMIARSNSVAAVTWLSRHDATTGLPTRRVIDPAERYLRGIVALISLRDLEEVSAQFSIAAAEEVRGTFAQRLSETLPTGTRLVQYRESAFLAHLPDLDRGTFGTLFPELIQKLSAPIVSRGASVTPSLNSAGVAVSEPLSAETALQKLAMTLPVSYAQGPNSHVWYDVGIEREHGTRVVMGDHLEHALEAGGLSLVFQPIRYLVGEKRWDLEVLLRWYDPELGHVSPVQFITVAEERGFIERMTRYVISESWNQVGDYVRGGGIGSVSINLSPFHMRSHSFVQQIDATFHYHSIPMDRYTLELTETALIDQRIVGTGILKRLKELGFSLSIDDFGTGYSNLDYLRRLEVDRLKIDKSFITGVTPGTRNHSILQAIVGLSRSLDMMTVAEGVESAQDEELALTLGCDAIQGYLSGRPMDRDSLIPALSLSLPEGT
jgi:EAL domain-containing protein (putative c-di-GMP-specific phosphodiesterase class I)/GGDEF domain-containing protein